MNFPSQNIESSLQLIRELYHVGLYKINDAKDAEEFSRKNMLHRVQIIFTSEALMTMKKSMNANTIYLLSDAFNISILVFFLKDDFMIFGPFTSLLQTEKHALHILSEHTIDNVSIDQYLRYRNLFPNLSEKEAGHIVQTLIRVCDPSSGKRLLKMPHIELTSGLEATEAERADYINLLQLRYANEKAFINCVTRGDADEALEYLNRMQRDVRYMKNIGSTLENERIGCAITRTTLRLSAIKAGLTPYIIDKLSSQNTREISGMTRIEKILESKENMVRNFCLAIKKQQSDSYSAIISAAVFYLEHHFSEDIDIATLSSELAVSRSYLMALFKKELSTSPINYLRKVRIKKACLLLSGTNLSIQTISEQAGIPDSNYFVKQFKKETGMTPTEYRKKNHF